MARWAVGGPFGVAAAHLLGRGLAPDFSHGAHAGLRKPTASRSMGWKIEIQAISAGYWPLLLSSHGSADLVARGIGIMRSLKVTGALVAPLGDASNALQLERLGSEVPVVLFDTPLDGSLAFVGTDNGRSIGQMVEYLCETGSAPCYLSFPDLNATSRERRNAYARTMTLLGHEPEFVATDASGWDFEQQGFEAARRALASGGFPTDTVLCASDRFAFGVLAACHGAGLSVGPGLDLRVAGHDDHPLSQFTCPALTTVAQDYSQLSEIALETLLAMADGRETGLRSYRTSSALIRRRSA